MKVIDSVITKQGTINRAGGIISYIFWRKDPNILRIIERFTYDKLNKYDKYYVEVQYRNGMVTRLFDIATIEYSEEQQ